YLDKRDPFGIRGDRADGKRVIVNLSPGTPAMSATWLFLHWNNTLSPCGVTTEFIQGDGGINALDGHDPAYNPVRLVDVSRLARVEVGPPPDDARSPATEDLPGPPYDELYREIEQAAMLGMP